MLVSFGTFYEMYGTQIVEIPDDVDDIEEYIQDNFEDYPLPKQGEYILGSAKLDIESIVVKEKAK